VAPAAKIDHSLLLLPKKRHTFFSQKKEEAMTKSLLNCVFGKSGENPRQGRCELSGFVLKCVEKLRFAFLRMLKADARPGHQNGGRGGILICTVSKLDPT
jgi:hypothetical protein